MAKGRPPKINEKRVLEGGTQRNGAVSHRPISQNVVLAPRITDQRRPEMPADLPKESRELWDDAIEYLIDRNIAQMIDSPALKLACHHYGMAMQASQVIAEHGRYTRGSTGQIVQAPWVKDFNEQSALFLRYAAEFGLTTLARTRLGLLDVTRRSMETDLQRGLGRNPRRTNRESVA